MPEQRAKAVVERFAAEFPSRSVPELDLIVISRSVPTEGSNRLDPPHNDQNYASNMKQAIS